MNTKMRSLLIAGLFVAGMVAPALAEPRPAGSKVLNEANTFDGSALVVPGYSYVTSAPVQATAPAAPAERAYSAPATAQPAPETAAPAAPKAAVTQPERRYSAAPQVAPVYAVPAGSSHVWSFGVRPATSKILGNM